MLLIYQWRKYFSILSDFLYFIDNQYWLLQGQISIPSINKGIYEICITKIQINLKSLKIWCEAEANMSSIQTSVHQSFESFMSSMEITRSLQFQFRHIIVTCSNKDNDQIFVCDETAGFVTSLNQELNVINWSEMCSLKHCQELVHHKMVSM